LPSYATGVHVGLLWEFHTMQIAEDSTLDKGVSSLHLHKNILEIFLSASLTHIRFMWRIDPVYCHSKAVYLSSLPSYLLSNGMPISMLFSKGIFIIVTI